MKFKYEGRFPMFESINGESITVNPGDVIEAEVAPNELFVSLESPELEPQESIAPKPTPKPRKKRKPVDANDTQTSSVW